jgi:ATP-binding protein involved in chromosome partitioning
MNFTEQDVLKALSHVDDPDLHKDLVTLNMVRDIVVNGNALSFSVYLTTPACPLKDMIKNACLTAISHFIGDHVVVDINMTAEVTADKKTNAALPNVRNIIAVGSGKGGVGKSTIAAALATTLSKMGANVGILDADIYGPSIPILFGVQNHQIEMEVVDGRELMKPVMAGEIKLFSIGFLSNPNEAVVWRGPMISKALQQFITGVNWGQLDYLIIDLPPGTGDIQLTLAQTLPISGAVIVTTPQNVAIADARKACAMFNMQPINIPILGIIENMSYFIPDDAPDKKYFIFGKGGAQQLAEQFKSQVLGSLPISVELMNDSDQGKMHTTAALENFTEIAQQLARQLAINNSLN